MTKTYKFKKNLFTFLSIFFTFAPLLVFIIIGFVQGTITSKLVLSLTSIGAILLAFSSVFMKLHLKSPIFIILIGLWVALENLLPCIALLSFSTIMDELFFAPLAKKYRELYTINREIDKRGIKTP